MNVSTLQNTADGERTIEIRCNEVSYRTLVRVLKSLPGVLVTNLHHNPLNDDAAGEITFKARKFILSAPFSDFHISTSGDCPEDIWDEFVQLCRDRRVRWWERII